MAATHPMDGLVPLKGSRALSLPEAAHYAKNARRAGCHGGPARRPRPAPAAPAAAAYPRRCVAMSGRRRLSVRCASQHTGLLGPALRERREKNEQSALIVCLCAQGGGGGGGGGGGVSGVCVSMCACGGVLGCRTAGWRTGGRPGAYTWGRAPGRATEGGGSAGLGEGANHTIPLSPAGAPRLDDPLCLLAHSFTLIGLLLYTT